MNDVYLESFDTYVKEELKNAIKDIKPKCQAKCRGKKCDKIALHNMKTCKKHINYKFIDSNITYYHNHLPGEVGVNCALCQLSTNNISNCTKCIV